MTAHLHSLTTFLVYSISAFVLLYLGKLAYHLFHPKVEVEGELVDKDNFAFAISYGGYFLGLVIALGGAISGPTAADLIVDLRDIALFGILSILLLNLSIEINKRVLLRKFDVFKEIIVDRNPGTAVVQAATSVSTGLIILFALSGEGGDIFTALGIWLISQLAIIAIALIYNLITPYDIYTEIEKDNSAVGVGFAGIIIAITIIICRAISHKFESWGGTLTILGIELAIGMVFLPLMRWIVAKVLMPSRSLTDEVVNQEVPNVGAALIEAVSYITAALIIGWSL